MPNPSLKVTDLEGDFKTHVNVGLLQAPLFPTNVQCEQVYLPMGWSMFSFNVNILELEDWDYITYPQVMMGAILKQFLYKYNEDGDDYLVYNNSTTYNSLVQIVKDNPGNAYLPEWNFDGLGVNLVSQGIASQFQGYQIKLNPDMPGIYYIKTCGPYYEPTTMTTQDFPIRVGWNMIGMPFPEINVTAVEFCQNFVDKVIIMKTFMGTAYLPEWNFNGIGNIELHQGYQIKLETTHTNNAPVIATWQTGGGIIDDDPIDDTPIVDDNPNIDDVIHIDDTPIIADTNMTIKVPSDIIINVLPDLDISTILKQKILIINKHLGFDFDIPDINEFLYSEEKDPVILENVENLIETNEKFEEKLNQQIINTFMYELRKVINRFPPGRDPSGFSSQAVRFIDSTFAAVNRPDKPIFNNSLIKRTPAEELQNFIQTKSNFRFTFFVYNNNLSTLVGKIQFSVTKGVSKLIITIPVQGDDSTTSILEGLVAGEIPIVYFFTGEKYYFCNLNLSYQQLQFVDKKELNITEITFGPSIIDIFA